MSETQYPQDDDFETCQRCSGKGYHHGFGEDGADPDWCTLCGGPGYIPKENNAHS